MLETNFHIGIIAPEFPPERGGMQTYAWELVRGLLRRGCQVTVLTLEHRRAPEDHDLLQVYPCLQSNWLKDRKHLKFLERCDVVHATNAVYAVAAKYVRPFIVSIHGNDFMNPNPIFSPNIYDKIKLGSRIDFCVSRIATPRLFGSSLVHVDAFIANSKYTANVFVKKYESCCEKTNVAYLGVSDMFFDDKEPRFKSLGLSNLLTVSRLSEDRKNVGYVLKALANLASDFDFRYNIVGDGCLRDPLQKLAHELGLEERVSFLGQIDDVILRQCYDEADLFILTPKVSEKNFEGFGIVYLEANARGVPVLAVRQAGPAEAVAEGESGFFVDEPDIMSIQSALRAFLSRQISFDPVKCVAHANSFRWDAVIDRVLAVYDKVLNERKAAADSVSA